MLNVTTPQDYSEWSPSGDVTKDAPVSGSVKDTNLPLTKDQQTAVTKIKEFLLSNESFFLLAGYAGTGKTYTISYLLHDLLSCQFRPNGFDGHWKICMTAPTNKAVRVLEKMVGDSEAGLSTIHSLLGLRLKTIEDRQVLEKDPTEISKIDRYNVVFVDECSMISMDLYNFILTEAVKHGIKFIFIGDPAQLPPVDDADVSVTFKVPNKYILKKIVRQAADNPIIKLATAIRQSIYNGEDLRISDYAERKGLTGVSVVPRLDPHFESSFTSNRFAKDHDSYRVLSWTNRCVNMYNDQIRPIYWGEKPSAPFCPGEKLITASAIHEMSTSEEFGSGGKKKNVRLRMILNVDVEGEVVSCQEVEHPWLLDYDRFRVWEVEFRRLDLPGVVVTGYLPFPEEEARVRSYLNEFSRSAREAEDGTARARNWDHFWFIKNAFSDLRPCYSITVHRSQGSTFRNVFVDVKDIMRNHDRTEALQCLYVAVTRASNNVVLNTGKTI